MSRSLAGAHVIGLVAMLLGCKELAKEALREKASSGSRAQPAATPAPAPAVASALSPTATPEALAPPTPQAQSDPSVGCPTCPPKMQGANLTTRPPTMEEWSAVGEITVRHSTPLRCETKMVREWLKVKCTGTDVLGVAFERTGGPWGNVPAFSKEGNANIVVAVRQGVKLRAAFRWTWGTRVLGVDFPQGAARPTIEFDASRPASASGTACRCAFGRTYFGPCYKTGCVASYRCNEDDGICHCTC